MAVKRAPLVTVKTDDFKIEVDEETYHPHAGETVTFKRRVTSRDLLTIARAGDLQGQEGGAKAMALFFHDEACAVLGRAIFAWTWTDPYDEDEEGNPIPLPKPNTEALRDLDAMTELQYLLEKWLDVTSPGTYEGNPQ